MVKERKRMRDSREKEGKNNGRKGERKMILFPITGNFPLYKNVNSHSKLQDFHLENSAKSLVTITAEVTRLL